jgi:hypothetical protein
MVSLFGKQWKRNELIRYVGNMDQLAGIKLVENADGSERGTRALHVWTGSGLHFQVLADRALDISAASYKDMSLAWISSTGDAHPAYYEPEGLGWLRTFQAGLLVTCGLDQFGSPSVDNGEAFGQHGRISATPARAVSYRTYWNGDEYELEISGEVRQTRVYGENLVLRRRITTRLGSSQIQIDDTVTNEGFSLQPHMILYHFNFGFPLLTEQSRLKLDALETVPRDSEAEKYLDQWQQFLPPTANFQENVYRHKPRLNAEKRAQVQLENPDLKLGMRLSFDPSTLPNLYEWKQMGEGTYVLGLEPGNSVGMDGRARARELNDLPELKPGESRAYHLQLEVFEN